MADQTKPESDETLRPPPRPRWVIWLVVGVIVAVLVFLGLHLLMGGGRMNHGGGHDGANMGMQGETVVFAEDPA